MNIKNNILNKKIVINNLLINYYFIDKGFKDNIIFLHGWRSSSNVWFDLINNISEMPYNIYAFDLPCFGLSEMPQKPLGLSDFVTTLNQFITKLKISNVTLVGHSHGGRIAMSYLINSSQVEINNISKLILIDSSGIKSQNLKVNLISKIAKIVKPIFENKAMKPLKRKIYSLIADNDYVETPELRETYLNIIRIDLSPDLKKILLPTYLIWGENDKDTPLEVAYILRSNIINSKLNIIKSAGHFPFIDKSEDFLNVFKEDLNNNIKE